MSYVQFMRMGWRPLTCCVVSAQRSLVAAHLVTPRMCLLYVQKKNLPIAHCTLVDAAGTFSGLNSEERVLGQDVSPTHTHGKLLGTVERLAFTFTLINLLSSVAFRFFIGVFLLFFVFSLSLSLLSAISLEHVFSPPLCG